MKRTPALSTATWITTLVGGLAANLAGQAATGGSHGLLQNGTTQGRVSQSSSFVLESSFSGGTPNGSMQSPNYALSAGFPSVLDTPAMQTPWLTAVRQGQVALRNQATIQLDGADLAVGVGTTVEVDGIPATVVSRTADRVTVRLPMQPAPGFLPIRIANTVGTTEAPRGVTVLPVVDTDPPAAPGKAFDLVFHGTQGDQVIWALGIAVGPPFSFPGVLYGLAIQPPAFIVYSGFLVTRADGELRLSIPPQNYPPGLIYVQGLMQTSNPGYGPAAFTNVLRL